MEADQVAAQKVAVFSERQVALKCHLLDAVILILLAHLLDRPLDTIVMDPKLKSYIVEDAKEFF